MNENTKRSNQDIEADSIRNTERARLRSLVDGDIENAKLHHADDFQLITPIGLSLSKEEYLGAIASGHIQYLMWEPETIEVRLYGKAAVIRYQSQLEVVFDGFKVPRSRYWHTDSYEYQDGRWQVVWSQATEIKVGV